MPGRYKITLASTLAWCRDRDRDTDHMRRWRSLSDDELLSLLTDARDAGVVEGCNNTVRLLAEAQGVPMLAPERDRFGIGGGAIEVTP